MAGPRGERTVLRLADLRFSQASIFPALTNGTSLAEFFDTLVASGWNEDFEPPRAVRVQAQGGTIHVAFDNRRAVTLRWMLDAGLKESARFLVFDAGEALAEEVRSADIGLRYAKFSVGVGEEDLRALAASLGAPLERLASKAGFAAGDLPRTWGDVLLARTSAQRLWGAPGFPLLGQVALPWVKWDVLGPYAEHCRRLRELPEGHPVVLFRQPRCMFDRRSRAALAEFVREIPREEGAVALAGGVPEFGGEWRRFLDNVHRWCDDVLEGAASCTSHTWCPSPVCLAGAADGPGHVQGLDLAFHAARVDLVVSLEHSGGAAERLVVPVAERGPGAVPALPTVEAARDGTVAGSGDDGSPPASPAYSASGSDTPARRPASP